MAQQILIINGGSSSIKFAVYESGSKLPRLRGKVERIGLPGSPANHEEAIAQVIEAIDRGGTGKPSAIGHRIVHGGPKYSQSMTVTAEVIEELRRLIPLDPEHLPSEIAIIEALGRHYPDVAQVACFDTAFHRQMPRVAQIVAIPRKVE